MAKYTPAELEEMMEVDFFIYVSDKLDDLKAIYEHRERLQEEDFMKLMKSAFFGGIGAGAYRVCQVASEEKEAK